MDMVRLLASVILSPVGNESLERGVHGESQCRVATSIFLAERRKLLFVGMRHRAYMELQVLRDGVALRFSFFFLVWGGREGGLWRSTSSVADTLRGKTKLTEQEPRPFIRQSQQFRYLTQHWSGYDDVLQIGFFMQRVDVMALNETRRKAKIERIPRIATVRVQQVASIISEFTEPIKEKFVNPINDSGNNLKSQWG